MHFKRKLTGTAWLLFLLYVGVLLKLVLFKYPSGLMVEEITLERLLFRLQHAANFTPFKTIAYYLSGNVNAPIAFSNIGGNILLFGPLGSLVPFLLPRFSRVRQIASIAFGASLFLELAQVLVGLGGFDVDDLLLNVLGGILGVLAFHGVRRLVPATFVGATKPNGET